MLSLNSLKQRLCLPQIATNLIRRSGHASQRCISTAAPTELEEVHNVSPRVDRLDSYLEDVSKVLSRRRSTSVQDLYQQYLHEAGNVIDRVVPYDERPLAIKRADATHTNLAQSGDYEGDGLVLVVHAQLDATLSHLEKTTVCSGFVLDASVNHQQQGDTIVTCAHTLEEVSQLSHYSFNLVTVNTLLTHSRYVAISNGLTKTSRHLLIPSPSSFRRTASPAL